MTLASFNAAPAGQAMTEMFGCCASSRFARALTDGRPYRSLLAAHTAVDLIFDSLTWDDVLEAMAEHPRIGDRASGRSAAEQSGVADASRAALIAGNAEYEDRFGHVFLICATGLSGAAMLSALRERLNHTKEAERTVACAELRKITHLRVGKALAE